MDKQDAVVVGTPAENPSAGPPEPSEANIAAGQSGSEPLGAKTDDNNAPELLKIDIAKEEEELRRQNELSEKQIQQIENEQKTHPLVGEKEPFFTVVSEYNEQNSPDYYQKAKELADRYHYIRRIRGDGNCFYRAVLTGIIENCFSSMDEARRVLGVCEAWPDRLIKLGFPDWTTSDFCEFFITWFKTVVNREINELLAFENLNEDHTSNYLLMFFRLIASGYLKEHADEYEPFIDCFGGLAEFCAMEIESMWKEADHLAITGLVHALDLGVRIEYMDRSAAPNGGWHYDFPPDQKDPAKIVLLYRPGHYDLLFRA
ncbi:hypothetical protein WR25_24443 [Diploscapter pachys]|uniref:Ubiquitin thioesterase n=1 Tax=Diploscapter pachys TaxID=2018661 RepID=A0A2A2LJB2_9BILA|nr:hypothetical protein WR25_24443 [Diploscapter pachys]